MKKIVKRTLVILACVVVVGFVAFLYLIPPFTLAPPESFSDPEGAAPPSMAGIKDDAERLIAERGRYLVLRAGCTGCHTVNGSAGPAWNMYLAGGMKLVAKGYGTFVSRNLTSDSATGLSRYSNGDILRVLQAGVMHNGRVIHGRLMPWTTWSKMSAEDQYAVVVFLRHLVPVAQRIPDPQSADDMQDTAAIEEIWPGDYSAAGR